MSEKRITLSFDVKNKADERTFIEIYNLIIKNIEKETYYKKGVDYEIELDY